MNWGMGEKLANVSREQEIIFLNGRLGKVDIQELDIIKNQINGLVKWQM